VFSVQSFSYLFLPAQTTLILLKILLFNTFCVFCVQTYLAVAALRCALQALQAVLLLSLLCCYSATHVKRL